MREDTQSNEEASASESRREGVRQISPTKAMSLAIQTARQIPGNYGRRNRSSRMNLHMTELQEDEANYIITLTFRRESPLSRILGVEIFHITKEGDIVSREIRHFHGKIRGWLPIVTIGFLGILAIGGPILVPKVLSRIGGADDRGRVTAPVAIEPDTEEPRLAIEIPTAMPLPAPMSTFALTPTSPPMPTTPTIPLITATATSVPAPTSTPFPTSTSLPTSTPAPRAKYKIGDELILTMGSGDTLRQFPATVVMVFRLGDEPDPYWEYEVQWPNGLIQVGEFVLSREGGERISYDTAKQSVEAAVAAGRMTEEQAEAHLTELVATGFADGPSSR